MTTLSEVSLAAEEVAEFYIDANKSSFVTEKSVALEYVLLANDDFRDQVIVITEESFEQLTEAEVEQAATESERRARHILIADGEGGPEKNK